MTPHEYIAKMLPYAQEARAQTGVLVADILAQWGLESGWGTSELAQRANNQGGITHVNESIAQGAFNGGRFARYADLSQFTQDYIRVIKLSFYSSVRDASKSGDPYLVAKAFGNSPYDFDHYEVNGVKGAKLMSILEDYPELRALEGVATVPVAPAGMTTILLSIGALLATALVIAGAQKE